MELAVFIVGGIVLIVGLIIGTIVYLGGSKVTMDDEDEYPLPADRAIRVLQVIRMAHSTTSFERECIDYAIECVEIRTRLEKYIEERDI